MSPKDRPIQIFISYRREDTEGHAGRLYDTLTNRFGEKNVFMDIDNIEPGQDFGEVVRTAVRSSDVVVVLIGTVWASVSDSGGRRRLDNPRDWVRLEVETALEQGARVIPILVRGAHMPREDDLPDALKRLASRQALELSASRWSHDVSRLVATIERLANSTAGSVPPTTSEASRATREAAGHEYGYPLELSVVRSVLTAASADISRSALASVLLNGNDVVATDSYRLHMVKLYKDPGWGRLLLSSAALANVIQDMLPSLPRAYFRVTSTGVRLSCGDKSWDVPRVSGDFPSYSSLILPSNNLKEELAIARPQLDNMLRDWIARGGVTIRFSAGSPVTIALKTMSSELQANIDGRASVSVSYNPSFLLDLLEFLPVTVDVIRMESSLRPSVIRYVDHEQNEHIRVLTPVR